VSAVNGIATFNDISINRSAAGYTLTASSPGIAPATSGGFTIRNGPDARIVFITQPVSGIANVQMPAVSIAVQDALGNTNPGSGVSISINLLPNPNGALLNGASTRQVVNGVASFSALSVTKAGQYRINATTPTLTPVLSDQFEMIIGPPSKLVFKGVASIARVGAPLDPEITVEVHDVGDNVITSGSHAISLELFSNVIGATLTGTTTVTSVQGVARFPGLSISAAGDSYKLIASAPTIPGTFASDLIAIRDELFWSSVSSGYFHTCGRAVDGKVYCWGSNFDGELGTTGNMRTIPASVATILNFVTISAGRSHTCALAADSAAYCWGTNVFGQSGPGNPGGNLPRIVTSSVKFASVHAGYDHSCGLDNSGKAYCWGDNSVGQLGAQSQTPGFVPVSGSLTFSNITAGRDFTCGVTKVGEAYCWGVNASGEIGDGTVTTRAVPTRVGGNLTFSFVQAGGFHACGLTTDGKAYCWGQNTSGQLGNGQTTESHSPVAVAGSLIFVSLSVGNRHNCAVTASGEAYCWGDNADANLGDGTQIARFTPTLVHGGIQFTSVSAGRFHSCGVARNNSVYCWGSNGAAQLGDGTTIFRYEPVLVR
jgi:alpha-tubulin suppressor-like RCC1 family protein